MGILDVLNRDIFNITGAHKAQPTVAPKAQATAVPKVTTLSFPDTVPQELSGLNLKHVLEAHSAWKGRLVKIIAGTSLETPDIAVVSRDNACFLGKWLYSEGKILYGHLPEYELVRLEHAKFHCCAGEVLNEHLNGSTAAAKELLKTKFRKASSRNQQALTRLFSKANS